MNQTILSSAMATDLGEGKLWIQICSTVLKTASVKKKKKKKKECN